MNLERKFMVTTAGAGDFENLIAKMYAEQYVLHSWAISSGTLITAVFCHDPRISKDSKEF